MKYGTVCTGIGAPEVAWRSIHDWRCMWQSEIEPFPCKILKHHFPQVPNLGDMTKLLTNKIFHESTIDLLAGGTPCQSFSLAGLRGGMADSRGNLALEFCRLLLAKQPRWFLWENVPGVFSSFSDDESYESLFSPIDNTRTVTQSSDFATLLQGFRECGYSCSWRVLDSQYFGVPQRRRRVFVVGHLGNDWRPPFAVLFERHCLQGDITPGEEARKELAGTLTKSIGRSRGAGQDPGTLTPFRMTAFGEYADDETASALKRRDYKDATDLICSSIDCRNISANEEVSATLKSKDQGGYSLNYYNPVIYDTTQVTSKANGSNPKPEICHTLAKGQHVPLLVDANEPIVFQEREGKEGGGKGILLSDQSFALKKHNNQKVFSGLMVRRLTPLECERLQGFPDNYTSLPGVKDSARYSAIGNSMTTHVIEWLGRRIDKVDKLIHK